MKGTTKHLLFLSENIFDKSSFSLYCDDGLILLHNVNRQNMDQIKKNDIKIFKEIGFEIETKANYMISVFLDVTFNLTNST